MNKHKLTKLKQEYENNNNLTQNMLIEQKPDHHPHHPPPPQTNVSSVPTGYQRTGEGEGTSLVIGRVTAVVVVVAVDGEERVAGRAGLGGIADSGE